MDFKEITLEDKSILERYFKKWAAGNSEHSFANLYIWRNSWLTKYAIVDDILFMSMSYVLGEGPTLYFAPLPYKEEDYCKAMDILKEHLRQTGHKFEMRAVTKNTLEYIKQHCGREIDVRHDMDISEYVYLVKDLIDLAGRKYHAKRNHISKFLREHPNAEFSLLKKEDVAECIRLYNVWLEKKNDDDTYSESEEGDAVKCALNSMEELGLIGCVIRINGEVVAFSIGERVTDEMALIHIEKANPDIPGLYSYINREFLSNCFADLKYVNREEDMGIPGLRKAKMSYYPYMMIDKYTVAFKER